MRPLLHPAEGCVSCIMVYWIRQNISLWIFTKRSKVNEDSWQYDMDYCHESIFFSKMQADFDRSTGKAEEKFFVCEKRYHRKIFFIVRDIRMGFPGIAL